jgi:thioredoxin-related protein
VEEVPLLQKLDTKFVKQGLTIVGVSMDTELKPVQELVAQKSIHWQQVCDGKGFDGELAKLFNVQGTPTHYLLDRKGRIVGKKLSNEELSEVIARNLRP